MVRHMVTLQIFYFKVCVINIGCNEGSTRLYNNMTTITSNGLLRVSGIPQLCKDGGWSSVCTVGSIDSQLPSIICQSWNYQGYY